MRDRDRKRQRDRERQRLQWSLTKERRNAEYRARRDALLDRLGPVCVLCGCVQRNQLEFDHIDQSTRTWNVRHTNMLQRIRMYERDVDQGLIRVLCGPCNKGQEKPPDFGDRVPRESEKEAAAAASF